jgi:hypothetical protein
MIARVLVGGVGLVLFAVQFASLDGSAMRSVISDVIAMLIGIGLLIAPEGKEDPVNRPPGSTWGTWFADQERDRKVEWNVITGGVLVFAGLGGLLLKLIDW